MLIKIRNRYNRVTYKKIFIWFISLLLPFFIAGSLDFPVNADELLHYSQARKVIDWYQSGGEDKSCLETPWSNLKYYGQSVDNFTALINRWINPDDEYTTRHITGAIFGWLLLLFASLSAFEITGRYRTAVGTSLLLLLIPPVMGQYCNNLKDIPFAAGYAFSIYSMLRCFKRLPYIPWKYIILLTLSIAFLISVRSGGLVIYPYLLLFLVIWFSGMADYNILSPEMRKALYRLLFQLLVILAAGYFGGLLFWPFGLTDPISHPLESLSLMEKYSISIRQIFQGDWYWSTSLPGSYLFTWLVISLPEIILAGILFYLVTGVMRKERFSFYEFIILFTFVFPLFYVVIIDSNLYNGWRQMYFLAVPLGILSALGIERILSVFKTKKIILISMSFLLVLGALFPVIHYLQNPETAYVYFNKLSGGIKKAWSDYEYDYYGHGMKRACEWFDVNIDNEGTVKIVASNFDISVYLGYRSDIILKYVHYDYRSTEKWDYGIFGVNYIHPFRLKNNTWQPENIRYMITDHINPLALVTGRSNQNAHDGIMLARSGNYHEAVSALKETIPGDPNDFILYEYLAESYYNIGSVDDCRRTIKIGMEIHPFSDKLNMMEARLEFDRGEYENALRKCLEIVENNPKYINIAPLLISCYEKTGNQEMAGKLKNKYGIP